MITYIKKAFVRFGLNVIGLILKPYETYRAIIERSGYEELGIIGLLVAVYFAVASLVKTSLFRPFLLTKQWIVLMSGSILTFIVCVSLFWWVGSMLGRSGKLKGFILGWGYSLVPTILWFWMTSILYIILPPPRTTANTGIIFSALYLLISLTLLFWKVVVSYLSLRFGLRLDFGKILILSAVVLPILGVYSVLMYRMGVFRIPFI